MSWHDSHDPAADITPGCPALETVIVPRARDLGGFEVRRALPAAQRQMVGPFVFWDQMGAASFDPGQGIDVRPHPHIGLATVTYLFDGQIMHRDSLGSALPIRPGALNLMTAGRGIVHSERTPADARARGHRLFGIQAWVALPKADEECAPAFVHYSADDLPVIEDGGARLRLIAGEALGARSPVALPMATLYAEAQLADGAAVPLDARYEERGVYVAEGTVECGGQAFEAGQMLLFRPGDAITLCGRGATRLMLLGGDPMDGPRHIWWNFVSSSNERIEQARADWKAGRFPAVPGEHEFIPLPEPAAPQPARYP
jgi:hypothetical protein